MSCLASPVAASTWWKIGTSISTPLVVPSPRRSMGDWAKPTTATSVTAPPRLSRGPPPAIAECDGHLVHHCGGVHGDRHSEVMGIGLIRCVRLAGGLEAFDVLRGGSPLLTRFPDRLDPHTHPHLARIAAQDQVLERDVG